MSRVAKIPVVLGKGVEAKIENGFITVKGPKGTLSQKLNPAVRSYDRQRRSSFQGHRGYKVLQRHERYAPCAG